jgi:hypothetical protein
VHQGVAEADSIAEKDADGNLIFAYTWIKEKIRPFGPIETQTQCAYEEAPLIDGLTDKDVEHIEEQRANLFNLKMKLLHIAYRYLTAKCDYANFWSDCINTIAGRLSVEDYKLFNEI